MTEYILKRGEVGTLLEFTLKDANGAVNLNGWTVTVTARRGNNAPVIDDEACTLLPNQATTDKGKGYYTFTSESAVIPVGAYDLEFKGVAPGPAVHYFPKSREQRFAKLLVIDPLEDDA
jgi:hypothetical protein